MTRLCMLALTLGLALVGPASSKVEEGSDERTEREVRLMLPAFSGDQPLGQQVATVLNLQVWQTLRQEPTPNPRGLDFGAGTVVWDREPLEKPSFASAEERAAAAQAQLVLWGRAWTYADGVVVQPYLSLLADAEGEHPVFWEQGWDSAGERPLRLGFPRRRYEFAPIVLRSEVVEQFSLPSALVMFTEQGGGEELGPLSSEFTGLRHEGDFVRVKSGLETGWVELPLLSTGRSEVVDFTGAAIRMLRGDWEGAHELFQRVIDNPHTPASLAIDARLLQGVALKRRGENPWPIIEQAYALNPHSRITATYGLMSRMTTAAEAISSGSTARIDTARDHLREALESKRYVFSAEDPWMREAEQVLQKLEE